MSRAAGKDLSFSTARTKDGESFASELVGEEKGCGHLGFGRRDRQIGFLRLRCRYIVETRLAYAHDARVRHHAS